MRALLTLALFATVSACDAPPPGDTLDDDGPVEISVLNDGTVLVGDEETTHAELGEALDGIEAATVVSISAERDVTVGMLDKLQRTVVEAGVERVVFQSELR